MVVSKSALNDLSKLLVIAGLTSPADRVKLHVASIRPQLAELDDHLD